MMNFILMTLSFTVAILLASGIAVVLMLQPKVMKWYLDKVYKATFNAMSNLEKEIQEEDEL